MPLSWDSCEGCEENCATCMLGGKGEISPSFPLDILPHEQTNPDTYERWLDSNEAFVRNYIKWNYAPGDWGRQLQFFYDYPEVAYDLINDDKMRNNQKIARVLELLLGYNYGVTVILGRQRGGKTMSWAWLAECMHHADPSKEIYYFGEGMKTADWITLTDNVTEIENNSWLCIDEASIRLTARRSMKSINVWMNNLCAICAHKSIHLFFISQRPELLDKNIRRLALAFVLKPLNLQETDVSDYRAMERYIPDEKNQTGFISFQTFPREAYQFMTPMPRNQELWNLGEAFKNYNVALEEKMFGESKDKEEKKEKFTKKKLESELKKERIKTLLEETDLTQHEIAQKVGLSRGRVSNVKMEMDAAAT